MPTHHNDFPNLLTVLEGLFPRHGVTLFGIGLIVADIRGRPFRDLQGVDQIEEVSSY